MVTFLPNLLFKELELEQLSDFPFKVIWKFWAPPKVGIFAWEATWGKILTLDNLQRRGRVVANRYYFCGKEEETCNHILLHCSTTKDVRYLLFTFWCALGPSLYNERVASQLAWNFLGTEKVKVWQTATLCLFGRFGGKEIVEHSTRKKVFIGQFWVWSSVFFFFIQGHSFIVDFVG